MLVAAHERGEADGLQLAVGVRDRGHAAAVAADAVAEGELPVGVILAERLEPARQQAAPQRDVVRLTIRRAEARPAEKAGGKDVPARPFEA